MSSWSVGSRCISAPKRPCMSRSCSTIGNTNPARCSPNTTRGVDIISSCPDSRYASRKPSCAAASGCGMSRLTLRPMSARLRGNPNMRSAAPLQLSTAPSDPRSPEMVTTPSWSLCGSSSSDGAMNTTSRVASRSRAACSSSSASARSSMLCACSGSLATSKRNTAKSRSADTDCPFSCSSARKLRSAPVMVLVSSADSRCSCRYDTSGSSSDSQNRTCSRRALMARTRLSARCFSAVTRAITFMTEEEAMPTSWSSDCLKRW
mmetsp:Transcript_3022/g.9286  ORF Transcript_3022/g.9286 Transcript_3022/m.9286 type:complete len:263 (+) Transcript_3022:469-1257(+)